MYEDNLAGDTSFSNLLLIVPILSSACVQPKAGDVCSFTASPGYQNVRVNLRMQAFGTVSISRIRQRYVHIHWCEFPLHQKDLDVDALHLDKSNFWVIDDISNPLTAMRQS